MTLLDAKLKEIRERADDIKSLVAIAKLPSNDSDFHEVIIRLEAALRKAIEQRNTFIHTMIEPKFTMSKEDAIDVMDAELIKILENY